MEETPTSTTSKVVADVAANVATNKVVIQFRATGNAPILKQQFFKINANYKFQAIVDFVKKQLQLGPTESLFLYVNSAFAPAPDELISNLHKVR